jgi:hypothetical protein
VMRISYFSHYRGYKTNLKMTNPSLVVVLMVEGKDVAGLTLECFTDGLESREANRSRLAPF